MMNGYLLGFISATSIWVGIFFLKFWKGTRDPLFLGFGVAFLLEGVNRAALSRLPHPNEGTPEVYLVRMVAALTILIAILRKNYRRE